ncbi:MAG: hypothetical protein E2O38_03820 [Proteobacteria bacterium]|nr:MAG: hypothetical protein E2O38_03820 [Pseudomonadota bacterium]
MTARQLQTGIDNRRDALDACHLTKSPTQVPGSGVIRGLVHAVAMTTECDDADSMVVHQACVRVDTDRSRLRRVAVNTFANARVPLPPLCIADADVEFLAQHRRKLSPSMTACLYNRQYRRR